MAKGRIDLITYISSDIKDITNRHSTKLQLDMRNINSEANNKGIGRSSILISLQDKNFYSSLNSLIGELIKSVEKKQDELHITYKKEDLEKAEEFLKQCALNYASLYNNERNKLMERLNQPKDEIFENGVSLSIVAEVDKEFKRLILNLRLIKDSAEIRSQKKANAIGFATLLVSIITLIISAIGIYLTIKSK